MTATTSVMTATAAAAATIATATAAAAAAATLTLARLIDLERTTVDFRAIHRLDRCLSFSIGGHLDESETARTTGFAIHHDVNIRYLAAVLFERRAQLIRTGGVRQITDVQTLSHSWDLSETKQTICGQAFSRTTSGKRKGPSQTKPRELYQVVYGMDRPKSTNRGATGVPGPGGVKIELCVDSGAGAAVAQDAGADRIELCSALEVGGLTPSLGLIEQARDHFRGPIVLLVRPRPGGFTYDEGELRTMERDIDCALRCGLAGIAIGVLTKDGRVDVAAMDRLIEHSRPLEVTFHRAFDLCADFAAATDALLALGVDRVLTSGGRESAESGIDRLREVIARLERAKGRTSVMPGGGVSASNVEKILGATGAREIHASAGEWRSGALVSTTIAFRSVAPDESAFRATSQERARAIVQGARRATLRDA